MKDSDSRSSRHRSRHGTRSPSRDRERNRDRRDKDRTDRDRTDRARERDWDRDRYRDKDRRYSRDHGSRRYSNSPTHSRRSHSIRTKSKKSKRRRSSTESTDSSYSSDSSKNSRLSSGSRSSRISKKSDSRPRHTRGNSSDGNSSTMPVSAPSKPIDLNHYKIKAVLESIDEDSFVPKTFYSTRDREAPLKAASASDKVIIDLNTETVSVPKSTPNLEMEATNEIFHPKFLGDPQQKYERWVKRLYNYRQKCFRE